MRAIFSATLGTGNDADRSGCYSTRVWSPTGKEIGSLPSLLVESCCVDGDIESDQVSVVTNLLFKIQINPTTRTNLTTWAQTADKLLLEQYSESDCVNENISNINLIFNKAKEMSSRTFKQKKRFLPLEIRDNFKQRKTNRQ